jgi:hypothetical protein
MVRRDGQRRAAPLYFLEARMVVRYVTVTVAFIAAGWYLQWNS